MKHTPHTLLAASTASLLLAAGASAQFASTSYPVGVTPSAVAGADLDSDGDADVTHTHPTADRVTASLGDGTGLSFATSTLFAYPAGSAPIELVVDQLDASGRRDYAVVLNGANAVAIHLASGAWPGFSAPSIVGVAGTPFEAVSLDVENDGDRDIAVLSQGPAAVTILVNNGAGVFAATPAIPLPLGFAPHAIAAGNFNGGLEDLVVTGSQGSAFALALVNQTTGIVPNFLPPQSFFSDFRPFGVCTGDFDGNGLDDIAIDAAAFSEVTVLMNGTGLGSTTLSFAPTTIPLAPGVSGSPNTDIACADMNCDGLPDLAVNLTSSGRVAYLESTGGGSFAPPVFVNAPMGNADIVAIDIGGAPGIDLVTADRNTNGMTVLLNTMVDGCCTHVLQGGIGDNFSNAMPGGPEDACPGPVLTAAFGTLPLRGFDGPVTGSRVFLHTFGNLPSNIKSARMRLRVRADTISSAGDVFGLGFDTGSGFFSFTDTMGDLVGGPFASGATAGISLDLANLPGGINLIPKLNVDGRLDIFNRSNTAFDQIQLVVETCADSEREMNLSVSPLIFPGITTWQASGAPPSGIVAFLTGPALGAGPVTVFGQLCITAPSVLAFAPTDAFGNASFALPLPALSIPPCFTLSSQAVGFSGTTGEISNTFTQQFFD